MKNIDYLFKYVDPDYYLIYDDIKIELYLHKEPYTVIIHSLSDGLIDVSFDKHRGVQGTKDIEIRDRDFFRLLFEVKR